MERSVDSTNKYGIDEINDEMPYWRPPKLYVLSLKVVVDAIKEYSDGGGDLNELAFPISVCNDLVARLTSNYSASNDRLLSTIADSPWCRLTKLYMDCSRDRFESWPLTTLFRHHLTEVTVNCGYTVTKRININDIGKSLGNTLISLTLEQCSVNHESLIHGFRYFVKLAQLNMLRVSFCETRSEQSKVTLPALGSLEVLSLSRGHVVQPVELIEDIFFVQKGIKVLQLYNIAVEPNTFNLLTNLVVLDVSIPPDLHGTDTLSNNDSALMESLSKMPSLMSLDVSCRRISDANLQLFDHPHHHRMEFLGLFNTSMCDRQNINAKQVLC